MLELFVKYFFFQRVQEASETSHRLHDLYSSILAQTEHTRELLSDPMWEGLTEVW